MLLIQIVSFNRVKSFLPIISSKCVDELSIDNTSTERAFCNIHWSKRLPLVSFNVKLFAKIQKRTLLAIIPAHYIHYWLTNDSWVLFPHLPHWVLKSQTAGTWWKLVDSCRGPSAYYQSISIRKCYCSCIVKEIHLMIVDLSFLPSLRFKIEFHYFVVITKEADSFVLHMCRNGKFSNLLNKFVCFSLCENYTRIIQSDWFEYQSLIMKLLRTLF